MKDKLEEAIFTMLFFPAFIVLLIVGTIVFGSQRWLYRNARGVVCQYSSLEKFKRPDVPTRWNEPHIASCMRAAGIQLKAMIDTPAGAKLIFHTDDDAVDFQLRYL